MMNFARGILLALTGIALFSAIVIAFFSFVSVIGGGGIDSAIGMLCMSVPAVIVLAMFSNFLIRSRGAEAKHTSEFCCPACGYNMRGLTEARCPECGAEFTLDQIKLK